MFRVKIAPGGRTEGKERESVYRRRGKPITWFMCCRRNAVCMRFILPDVERMVVDGKDDFGWKYAPRQRVRFSHVARRAPSVDSSPKFGASHPCSSFSSQQLHGSNLLVL